VLFRVNACCNLADIAFSQSGSDSCICDVALHEIKHMFPLIHYNYSIQVAELKRVCAACDGGARARPIVAGAGRARVEGLPSLLLSFSVQSDATATVILPYATAK